MSDTAWCLVYLAGYIVLLVWTRRAHFLHRATVVPATLDLVSGICLSVPALAWLDADVAARCGDPLLRVLFACGVVGLVWFTRADVLRMRANPMLAPHLRRRFALLTLVAALGGAAPDVWWGALALAHAART